MAITFDTLEYVNALKAADVPDKQAEAQAKALRGVLDTALAAHTADMATRGDVRELEASTDSRFDLLRKDLAAVESGLRKDIEAMENRITIRLGAMLVVAVGVLLAVLPMLIAR